jgi:Ca2+-binding RTX toxin-like protein
MMTVAGAFVLPVGLAAAQSHAQTPTCFGVPATIVGTSGDDFLMGGPGPDVIVGLGGDDAITGGGGDDLLCGGPGSDIIFGGPGNDKIDGGDGQDALAGNAGNDELDGGGNAASANADFVSYENAPGSVQVDLSVQKASGADGSDQLKGIESAFGSSHDDVLKGDASANVLGGEAGSDTINGGGGEDSAWFDAAVNASLASGRATGEGSDTLVGMEGLIGSDGNDVLTGDSSANSIAGRGGNDVISGGGGDDREFGDAGNDHIDGGDGNDMIDGGAGNDTLSGGSEPQDTVSYLSAAFNGVSVSLTTHRATGGDGNDIVDGFANVSGSEFNDTIDGDAATNALYGNSGNDTINGGAGADFVGGGLGANNVVGGPGLDYCLQGSGAQRCEIRGVPRLPAEKPAVPPISPAGPVHRLARLRPQASLARLFAFSNRFPAAERRAFRLDVERLRWFAYGELNVTAASARPPVEYVGVPVCFGSKPYRTSVAPPRRVEPTGQNGEAEEAWWQGTLFRWKPGTGTWTVYKQTPWARGQLTGARGIAGVPIWQDRVLHAPVASFEYRVPAGRYTWRGEIYWPRTRASLFRPIEPHFVYASLVRPVRECRFGG